MRWCLDEAAAETWSVRTLQRNRLIAQALYDMGVIEHYGRGIKRIKEECDRNGNPYPDWTDRPGEFLTIYKVRGSQGSSIRTDRYDVQKCDAFEEEICVIITPTIIVPRNEKDLSTDL